MAKRSRLCLLYMCIFCIISVYISYLAVTNKFPFSLISSDNDFVVYTSNCKIPNFRQPYYSNSYFQQGGDNEANGQKCMKDSRHWTYREANKLMFNKTALSQDGLKFKDLSCCYKTVSTSENNAENWNNYSDCVRISHVQTEFLFPNQIPFEFIVVECSSKNKDHDSADISYSEMHPIAAPFRSQSTKDKIKYWRNHFHFSSRFGESAELPPNVLILGMDSTSRLNFRRRMTKTVKLLDKMKAVEMKGYTNSEERNHLTISLITSGYSGQESDSKLRVEDDTPLIWTRLDQAQYLTAYAENWSQVPDAKTSIAPMMVDYYMRTPLESEEMASSDQCHPQKMNDLLMGFNEALLSMSTEQKAPMFSISFFSTTTSTTSGLEPLDETFANFLQKMDTQGLLNNTILFFLGGYDQGQNLTPDIIEDADQTWYEDRLPNLWIWLPRWIREAYPEMQIALEINSGRLSSPFLIYWSINYILDKFLPKQIYSAHPEAQPTLEPPAQIRFLFTKRNNATVRIPRKVGDKHFFKEIPEWVSCPDVGIPQYLCTCNKPPVPERVEVDPVEVDLDYT